MVGLNLGDNPTSDPVPIMLCTVAGPIGPKSLSLILNICHDGCLMGQGKARDHGGVSAAWSEVGPWDSSLPSPGPTLLSRVAE